ncbi:MAG: glycosyltransferase family 39 protein [Lentisphaeria bacterium]|nr:glycosyltransferase family 39 protein [Lentisphaeria bacterium]
MKIIQKIVDHFRASDSEAAGIYGQDSAFSFRNFVWILLAWMFLWSVWPSLCIGNVSIDVAENIAWGDNFQFGYDKNPYFGAWLSWAVFRICPSEYVFYWMSQVAATLGLASVYFLTLEVTESRFSAFVAGLSALLIPFFSHSACEFNDDVMSIALWGWSALCFYRAVKKDSLRSWLGAGLFAGLALMTKYLAGALLLPLGLMLFVSAEGRKCWKRPGVYLAAAVFLVLVLPNLIWLWKHNFIAIFYAMDRARLDTPTGLVTRLGFVLDTFGDFVSRLILPLAALLVFRRSSKKTQDVFGRNLIIAAALAPFVLSLLFILTTGGEVLTPWLTPYFVFSTPLLVLWYRPLPERRTFRCFAAVIVVASILFLVFFGYEFLHKRPYLRKGVTYNVWPGQVVSDSVTRQWHERYRKPLPYVIGDRTVTCNVAFYSPDRPSAFFEHQVELSPWIDPADVQRRGAVILWTGDKPPRYIKDYSARLVMLPDIKSERAGVRWYRKLAGPLRIVTIHAAFLPPEEK